MIVKRVMRRLGLLVSKKYQFQDILRACQLNLKYETNRDSLQILQEVFVSRSYSDFFPFYEKAVIVDVGAHKGFFSIFASLNTAHNSRIIALEPSSANFDALKRNVATVGVTNVTTLNVGVFSESKKMVLNLRREQHSIFENRHVPSGSAGASIRESAESIDVVSLSDLLETQRIDQVDFLKMDCEGAEYPTLSMRLRLC